jgi:EAL domain-containing protein (putative c-di-GMP-specific phosphodiesterase class I)
MNRASKVSIADFLDRHAAKAGGTASLRRMLRAVRLHLGMDIAFLARFDGAHREFRSVDSDLADPPLREGNSVPLDEGFCAHVVAGRLPELMRNAADDPFARTLPATAALPVGAHLSVPVRLADGTTYGTFCCFSLTPDETLTERDLALLRVFAEMAAVQIDEERAAERARDAARRRLDAALAEGSLSSVYQPIVDLSDRSVAGFEALTRFAVRPWQPPAAWFAEAAQVRAGVEAELRAAAAALAVEDGWPDAPYLAINLSPEALLGAELDALLDGHALDRLVVEITEHEAVAEYERLARALAPLRARGLRVAIDDAGAGQSSFRHVVDLAPDIVKIDMSITRGIDTDRSRRALAAALTGFAREIGMAVVAEGLETKAELAVVCDLGIDAGQGFLLGRPMPCAEAIRWAEARARA